MANKQTFTGKTEDAAAPFLSGEFWEEGKSIKATVDRFFEIEDEEGKRGNYALTLLTPHVLKLLVPKADSSEMEEISTNVVSIGERSGLVMAMQAARIPHCKLLVGDVLFMECTGETPSKKPGQSPRKNFRIIVTRDNVPSDDEVGF